MGLRYASPAGRRDPRIAIKCRWLYVSVPPDARLCPAAPDLCCSSWLVLTIAGGIYARSRSGPAFRSLTAPQRSPAWPRASASIATRSGCPTITGTTREDVARALGFLHAQDRFFQMDLQRRQPAGELSAWSALARWKSIRRCACIASATSRSRARRAPSRRTERILEAYADGVNAGLNALGAPPFEYLVLRATPEPWQPEDSILTVLAMFNTLQGRQAAVRTIARRAARHAARADVSIPLDRRIRVGDTGRGQSAHASADSRRRRLRLASTTIHGSTETRNTEPP